MCYLYCSKRDQSKERTFQRKIKKRRSQSRSVCQSAKFSSLQKCHRCCGCRQESFTSVYRLLIIIVLNLREFSHRGANFATLILRRIEKQCFYGATRLL
uniref:Uncharacterized protein n=1 Tax=Ditylenchus dipsaci TaxID=166011 RepID=A0A915CQ74_9BILA